MEGNWIGEGGAREVTLALHERKEAGLPAMKLRVSPRICPDIFSEIVQLTASSGTKKKRSGKGKKKVSIKVVIINIIGWSPNQVITVQYIMLCG